MRRPPRGPYANRPRGMREKAAPGAADELPAIMPLTAGADTEGTRRWASPSERPTRCASPAESTPTPTRLRSPGKGARPVLIVPRLNFLSRVVCPSPTSASADEGRNRDAPEVYGVYARLAPDTQPPC